MFLFFKSCLVNCPFPCLLQRDTKQTTQIFIPCTPIDGKVNKSRKHLPFSLSTRFACLFSFLSNILRLRMLFIGELKLLYLVFSIIFISSSQMLSSHFKS